MLHIPTRPNQPRVLWSLSQFTRAKGGFSLQTPLHSTALSSCKIRTHKAEISLPVSHYPTNLFPEHSRKAQATYD